MPEYIEISLLTSSNRLSIGAVRKHLLHGISNASNTIDQEFSKLLRLEQFEIISLLDDKRNYDELQISIELEKLLAWGHSQEVLNSITKLIDTLFGAFPLEFTFVSIELNTMLLDEFRELSVLPTSILNAMILSAASPERATQIFTDWETLTHCCTFKSPQAQVW